MVFGVKRSRSEIPLTPSLLPQKERAAAAEGINTGSEYEAWDWVSNQAFPVKTAE